MVLPEEVLQYLGLVLGVVRVPGESALHVAKAEIGLRRLDL